MGEHTIMNLQSIVISNCIGFLMLVILLISSHLVRQRRQLSDRIFTAMILIAGISCLVEMLTFCIDGLNFPGAWMLQMVSNSWLFVANATVAYFWCVYIDLRLFQEPERVRRIYLKAGIPALLSLILILLNFFGQFVFSIDAQHYYHREPIGYGYYLLTFGYLGGSVVVRQSYYHKVGHREFFPIWMFIAPILIGATAQFLVYGISVGWCSVAMGLLGIYMSLQNELSYIDPLTKLYNRNYLDHRIADITRQKSNIGGLMIDLDYFKKINDQYGHSEGDQALIQAAEILRRAVPSKSTVVRFAGDEFIVLYHTKTETDMLQLKERIRTELTAHNRLTEKPYQLSFSIGHSMYSGAPDAFLSQMDERMYAEKMQKHCTR